MSGLTLGTTLFCCGSGEGLELAFVSLASALDSVGAEGVVEGAVAGREDSAGAGVEEEASAAETQLVVERVIGQVFGQWGMRRK
jgi:hypothetical protein